MKTIRNNVFETNSSSMHSISLSNKDNFTPDISGVKLTKEKVFISGNTEFGWGYEEYNDAGSKIMYLLLDNYMTEAEMTEYLKKIFRVNHIEYQHYTDGYIDHQSVGTSREISNEDKLFNFIFNKKSVLVIDNDNH